MSEPEVSFNVSILLEPDSAIDNLRLSKKELRQSKKDAITNWGFPGHLTKEEGDVYVAFRDECSKRDPNFNSTVHSFTDEEEEAYCLTRWLRARKFSLSDTLLMIEQATECRATPRTLDYYPNPHDALGVDPAVYLTQYPQLYSGFSKDGCPVFYSKTGKIQIDGLECITTVKSILDYHWHVMQHDYQRRLLGFKKDNPKFKKFACVSVLDLAGLTVAALSSRTLDIIKKQSYIDSLCFPETMHKTIIVNAPKFFSMTWSIIKGWLDARTVSKIELFTSIKAAKSCLMEIIEEDQIPSDYGGTGESTEVTLEKEGMGEGGRCRILTEIMHVRSYQNVTWNIAENEELDLSVYTRAIYGAKFCVSEFPSKKSIVEETAVVHTGGDDGGDPNDKTLMPTCVCLTSESGRIKGPMKVKVKGQSMGGRFGSECYLVVGSVFSV